MKDAVEVFKALADPNRLRVYWLLTQIDDRITVAEAMDVLDESHYNASRILKVLRQAGLVTAEREGKWVFYSLASAENDDFQNRIMEVVRVIPKDAFQKEIERCKLRLGMRKNGECVTGPGSDAWRKVRAKMKPARAKRAAASE